MLNELRELQKERVTLLLEQLKKSSLFRWSGELGAELSTLYLVVIAIIVFLIAIHLENRL